MTKEERKIYAKAYYQKHKREILENAKERYKNDENYRETIKDQARRYKQENKEEVAKKMKVYQLSRKTFFKEYNANYYEKNKTRINTRRNNIRRGEKVMVQY